MRRSIEVTGAKVAILAVVLVAVVLLAAAMISHTVRAAEDQAAAESVAQGGAQVTAGEVAQWIVEKRQDYQLVDLREPWHFDDYHVPTAINLPLAGLFKTESLRQLDRKKKIVVYSLGAGDAARAQLLLAMRGYRAFALNDGIIGWWDEVMTPTSIRSAAPSPSGYRQAQQLREYFMTGAAPVPAAPPAVVPPALPPAAPAKPAAKPAAPPAKKAEPQPTKKPKSPTEKEKERLKLGTGCS